MTIIDECKSKSKIIYTYINDQKISKHRVSLLKDDMISWLRYQYFFQIALKKCTQVNLPTESYQEFGKKLTSVFSSENAIVKKLSI